MVNYVTNLNVYLRKRNLLLAPEGSHHIMKMIVLKLAENANRLVGDGTLFASGSFVIYTHLVGLNVFVHMITFEWHFLQYPNITLYQIITVKTYDI